MSTTIHVHPTKSDNIFRVREFSVEDGEHWPSKIVEHQVDLATAQALLDAGEIFIGPFEQHLRLVRERSGA
jgi:hypothetical protein